jgi:hypothetical protein
MSLQQYGWPIIRLIRIPLIIVKTLLTSHRYPFLHLPFLHRLHTCTPSSFLSVALVLVDGTISQVTKNCSDTAYSLWYMPFARIVSPTVLFTVPYVCHDIRAMDLAFVVIRFHLPCFHPSVPLCHDVCSGVGCD